MATYLEKSALFPAQILEEPVADLGLVVVIPAYEEAHLLESLESLKKCQLPTCGVEVIVLVNGGEKDTLASRQKNKACYEEAKIWAAENSSDRLRFFILYHPDLPARKAGVGLARKIGMDEAVYRLEQVDRATGIIACFDADSLCQDNYLEALYHFFVTHPKMPACSIDFEHPLEGEEYSEDIYQAIIAYELHLRYYVQIQRWAGFPYAFHTVGSSMAVRADAYQQQGGMNRRKAGEDFYFLHKFIPLGHFGELHATRVIPSPRISDRVPFGTGKSVKDILTQKQGYLTYAPPVFEDLQAFLDQVPKWYEEKNIAGQLSTFPLGLQEFLKTIDAIEKIREIQQNTSEASAFTKRFYRWFNAFQLMKYVHFARDHYYPNVPVEEAANWLLQKIEKTGGQKNAKDCLLMFRALQSSAH